MLDTSCRLGQNSRARQIVAEQLREARRKYNTNGGYSMESSKIGGAPVPFMQQMLHNKMLLLTMFIAVSAVAYFGIGLYMLLRH